VRRQAACQCRSVQGRIIRMSIVASPSIDDS
jgi:hypothetical protein